MCACTSCPAVIGENSLVVANNLTLKKQTGKKVRQFDFGLVDPVAASQFYEKLKSYNSLIDKQFLKKM